MSRTHRRGPPKHLEKMLFINHKEDLMLDDTLNDLTLMSRLKIMELDREQIRVRNELRNSRKKNITISEAMSSGLIPEEQIGDTFGQNQPRKSSITPHVQFLDRRASTSLGLQLSSRRASTTVPTQRKVGVVEQSSLGRSSTFIQPTTNRRMSIKNQFSRQPALAEADEYETDPNDGSRRNSVDTVGAYVLCEFQKMSQVVPDILRALAKKKERQQELDDRIAVLEARNENTNISMLDYVPDMNKVRKTVSSVKKLRYRMSISKKLEASKPRKSLHQMIKDKTDNMGEYDEFTDGTCALMKRRLDKKRRDSVPVLPDGQMLQRRQSVQSCVGEDPSATRRRSTITGGASMDQFRMNRSASVIALPSVLSRSSTNFGFGSSARLNKLGHDSNGGSQFIDEDELLNRQRKMRELENYDLLQERVDLFLVQGTTNCPSTVME